VFFSAGSPWIEQPEIPFLFDSTLCLAGLFCVFVNIRLQGKAWAWWTTLAAIALTLAFGVLIFVSALHPRDDFARSERIWTRFSVILMTPAAIASTLLILPPVRRRYEASGSKRVAT
jgi:hypothetical protein